MTRRDTLKLAALFAAPAAAEPPTKFQLALMTLPYGAFTFDRALQGIARAGFRYAAWGTRHTDAAGHRVPVLDTGASEPEAARLAARTRAAGLEPVMMFSTVNLENPDAPLLHERRIAQAAAARIPFLLTFGRTRTGEYDAVLACLRHIAPIARKAGVTVVVKQHGGNTATGVACSRIIREAGADGVKVCYDAGNVLDYENEDPIPDINACWRDVRAFTIKDHRNWPKDQDCGPGFGEIDHYRLLNPVARTGLTMPLAFENIFEPLLPRPTRPEGVDALARRAREYIETVIRGLRAAA